MEETSYDDTQGVLRGRIKDSTWKEHEICTPVLVVPGLTMNVYSVTKALIHGVRGSFKYGENRLLEGDVVLSLN